MTKEQATGLLQLQEALRGWMGTSQTSRAILTGYLANDEAEFIRSDIERLVNAMEVTEQETAAVIESFTQKIIAGFPD